MTNEEAIAILEEEADFLYGKDKPHNRTAFDMAIFTLSAIEDIKKEIKEKADNYHNALYCDGLLYALYVINKHIEGVNK